MSDLAVISTNRSSKFLNHIAFLHDVPPAQLDIMGSLFRYQRFDGNDPAPASWIVTQDAMGDAMFLLASGCAEVIRTDPVSGAVSVIHEFLAGSYFGEVGHSCSPPRFQRLPAVDEIRL